MSIFQELHEAAAATSLRFLKDRDDVAHLILVNRVDVHADWFKQLCLKHGTQEIYEQCLRFVARILSHVVPRFFFIAPLPSRKLAPWIR